MSDPNPRADPPRFEATTDQTRQTMADGTRGLPAWNRERLIEQFQRIDGSTRSDAEQQIVAFEQSFWGRGEIAPR